MMRSYLAPIAPVPVSGSQVGQYKLLREIAKGPLGKLYELRAEGETNALGGVARIVPLQAEPAEVVQALSDAAWDSMELRNDWALCVADVVFGEGWVALIHDYAEGTLLRSLHKRAKERQSAFPATVALRVALDVLEGLDKSRHDCAAAQITWKPGGSCATSLYLCGDGRTRALDGQLMATMMRRRQQSAVARATGYAAPELLDLSQVPDERTDVFAVGTLLWELLTGRELALESAVAQGQRPRQNLPCISLSIPKGDKQIAPGLTEAITAAVELDPNGRPRTLGELKTALVDGSEVATYAQVIEYVDTLLRRESTLFRLDLAPAPKLSEKGQSARPKSGTKRPPPKPAQLLALAKHAEAKEHVSQPQAQATPSKAAPALSLRPKKPTASLPIHSEPARGSTPAHLETAATVSAPAHLEAAATVSVQTAPLSPAGPSATAKLLAETVADAAREVHETVPARAPLSDFVASSAAVVNTGRQATPDSKRVFRLSLPMIAGIITATVTLAVLGTILVYSSFTSPSAAPLASVSQARPVASVAPPPAPSPIVTAPSQPSAAAPSAASVATPPTSASPPAVVPQASPLSSRSPSTVNVDKAPVKSVKPKPRRLYVPTEL